MSIKTAAFFDLYHGKNTSFILPLRKHNWKNIPHVYEVCIFWWPPEFSHAVFMSDQKPDDDCSNYQLLARFNPKMLDLLLLTISKVSEWTSWVLIPVILYWWIEIKSTAHSPRSEVSRLPPDVALVINIDNKCYALWDYH